MTHPDDSTLAEYVQGTLSAERLLSTEAHLSQCGSCRPLVAQLAHVLAPAEPPGPRKGLVVGRYVVLEPIGAGALGEVFSAYDTTLERTVALKWLFAGVSDDREALRARLIAEARALAQVQHPHVVAVYDVLAQADADVIVMELVTHARSFRSFVGARQPWRETVQSFLDAADGLAAAHERHVTHRDFKPDNVLVTESGRVVVVDFGLARQSALDTPDGPARASTISGTPAYLAPERWQGHLANDLSDQFSFCVSLYECLTGRLPFAATTLDARLAEIRQGPPPFTLDGGQRVIAALNRGLAFDAAARWPSMRALSDELEQALRSTRRRQAIFLGVALAVGTIAALVFGLQHRTSRCDGVEVPVTATWSSERRSAVIASLRATGHPAAAPLTDRIVTALDRSFVALAATRRRACMATAFEGESELSLAGRQTCIGRRLADLDALVRGFEHAEPKSLERAMLAIESLTPASECLSTQLTARDAMPGGPARDEVQRLIAKVAEVRAARLLGKTKDSIALAETMVPAIRTTGWKPLLSDALLEWGKGLQRTSKFDEARLRMLEALELAIAAHDDEQAFSATVDLAYLDGIDRKLPEAGAAWVRLSHAYAPTPSLSEALRVGNVEAVLLIRADKAGDAVAPLQALEARLVKEHLLESVNGARLLTNLSAALRESGKASESVELSRRSLEIMERVLSANHPDVAAGVNNLGSALSDLGRFDEAVPYFERSVELRETLFGKGHVSTATPLYNLGELAFRRGDGTRSLEMYRRSRLVAEAAEPDGDDAWDCKMGEGLALGLLGRHDESVKTLDEVLPQIEKRKLPAWNIAQARLGLATSLIALQRDVPRAKSLLTLVTALEGTRHEAQRTQAKAALASLKPPAE